MYVKFLLFIVLVFLASCSLAPKSLDKPEVLVGFVTYGDSGSRVEDAQIVVSRCFLPRSIVPICEFVPFAKYRSNSEGEFEALVYLKGLYRFSLTACVGGREHTLQKDLRIENGTEKLQSFRLSGSIGSKCRNDI